MNSTYKFVSATLVVALWGCGGGGSGGSALVLPPAPGAAGDATIVGIDSDSDGVRDDVQIAIANRYPTNAGMRNALAQGATSLQDALVSTDSGDNFAMAQASQSVVDATDCLQGSATDAPGEIGFLEQSVVNTPDRTAAYVSFNQAASNQFFGRSTSVNPCR